MVAFNGLNLHFEPRPIRHLRVVYSLFADCVLVLYLFYILWTVSNASTLVAQQEIQNPDALLIPNIYVVRPQANADPNFTVTCLFFANDDTSSPCAMTSNPNYVGSTFKNDPNNPSYYDPQALRSIQLRVSYTPSTHNGSWSFPDYIEVFVVDQQWDYLLEQDQTLLSPDDWSFLVNQWVVVDANQSAVITFRRTISDQIGPNTLAARLGFHGQRQSTVAVSFISTFFHQIVAVPNAQGVPTSVINVNPAYFNSVTMVEREEYSTTLLTALGSLSVIYGVLALVNALIFGSPRNRVLGYIHRKYYERNIPGMLMENRPFEEIKQSLDDKSFQDIQDDLKIEMMTLWPRKR